MGLAPAAVEEQGGGPELQWNYGFEPKRKRPKEQDFLDNNHNNNTSQISSVDFLQARSVSTGLGLSLDNTNNNNNSNNKAWLASSGESAFLGIVGDEIDREFQRQDAEIERYIKIQVCYVILLVVSVNIFGKLGTFLLSFGLFVHYMVYILLPFQG